MCVFVCDFTFVKIIYQDDDNKLSVADSGSACRVKT